MKKILRGVAAVFLSIVAISSFCVVGYAVDYSTCKAVDNTVSPMYIAISQAHNNLTIDTSGNAKCQGSTKVKSGYNAEVIVELQQYNNGWTTIKTWSSSDGYYSVVDSNKSISKGYSYRVKTTHRSYNSSWTQIESVEKYTGTVYY